MVDGQVRHDAGSTGQATDTFSYAVEDDAGGCTSGEVLVTIG